MRELKFRAWDKKRKRMFAVTTLNASGAVSVFIDDAGLYLLPAEQIELMQYTGLKDKNGKEIYVGDIIHRGALPKVNVFRNSVIRFDEESVGFIATSTRNGARTLFNGQTCDEIEVIGNIHENPELLEGEK